MIGRGLIARKTTAEKATIGKTIAVIMTVRKTIAMMITIRKTIVMIFRNRMTMNDIEMVLMTDRLASIDRITGNLVIIRSRRFILSVTRTISPIPTLVIIKMTLIPLSICQLPPFITIWLVWSSTSW